MIGLLLLIASVCTGFACYYLSCAFTDIPTLRTSKAMMAAKKQTGTGRENLYDVYLTRIARILSRFLHLDPVRRGKLETTLAIAGIPLTPEAYTIKAFLNALAVALLSLPLFLILPLFGFLILGLSVLMWFSTYYAAFDNAEAGTAAVLADILEDFQEDMVARAILMAGKAARYGDNFAEFDSDTKLFFD